MRWWHVIIFCFWATRWGYRLPYDEVSCNVQCWHRNENNGRHRNVGRLGRPCPYVVSFSVMKMFSMVLLRKPTTAVESSKPQCLPHRTLLHPQLLIRLLQSSAPAFAIGPAFALCHRVHGISNHIYGTLETDQPYACVSQPSRLSCSALQSYSSCKNN